MSRGRQICNMASSLLSHACRSGQTFANNSHVQLRRAPDPLASGVRCMATKTATKKTDSDPVTKAALVEIMVENRLFETKAAADSALSAGQSAGCVLKAPCRRSQTVELQSRTQIDLRCCPQ